MGKSLFIGITLDRNEEDATYLSAYKGKLDSKLSLRNLIQFFCVRRKDLKIQIRTERSEMPVCYFSLESMSSGSQQRFITVTTLVSRTAEEQKNILKFHYSEDKKSQATQILKHNRIVRTFSFASGSTVMQVSCTNKFIVYP